MREISYKGGDNISKRRRIYPYIILICILIIIIVVLFRKSNTNQSILEDYDKYVISRFQYSDYPKMIWPENMGETGYINSNNEDNDLEKEGYMKGYAFSNIESIINASKTVDLPERTIEALFNYYEFDSALLIAGSIDKISADLTQVEYPSTHGRVEVITYTLEKESIKSIDRLQQSIIIINGKSGTRYFKNLDKKEKSMLEQYPNMERRFPTAFIEVMGTKGWYSFYTNEQDLVWKKANGIWELYN